MHTHTLKSINYAAASLRVPPTLLSDKRLHRGAPKRCARPFKVTSLLKFQRHFSKRHDAASQSCPVRGEKWESDGATTRREIIAEAQTRNEASKTITNSTKKRKKYDKKYEKYWFSALRLNIKLSIRSSSSSNTSPCLHLWVSGPVDGRWPLADRLLVSPPLRLSVRSSACLGRPQLALSMRMRYRFLGQLYFSH